MRQMTTYEVPWGLYFTYLLSFTLFCFTVVSSCIIHYEVEVKLKLANIATIKILCKAFSSKHRHWRATQWSLLHRYVYTILISYKKKLLWLLIPVNSPKKVDPHSCSHWTCPFWRNKRLLTAIDLFVWTTNNNYWNYISAIDK